MIIDGKLLLAFVETLAFLSLMGWAVDRWLRTNALALYPAFGLVIFGVLVVPLTYTIGRYSTLLICVICVGIIILGVLKHFFWNKQPLQKFAFRPQSILLLLLGIVLVYFSLVQASKYQIPGGIDSAVHSNIIQVGLVQSSTIQGAYPLGMHISILFFDRLFQTHQEYIFLSLYIIIFLSSIAGLVVLAKHMLQQPGVMLMTMTAAAIDVSAYNNFLNGSGTHLLGIFFMMLLPLTHAIVQRLSFAIQLFALSFALTAIWYFHYPTLFFAFTLLWAWRIATQKKNSWTFLFAFGLSCLLSLPFQVRLIHDPTYLASILPAITCVLGVEIALILTTRWHQRFLHARIVLLLLAVISIILFRHNATAFLNIPTWYGSIVIGLAYVGLLATVVTRQAFSVMALYSFFGMTVLYAILQTNLFPGSTSVMTELVYYYGFTCSLILLAASGGLFILKRVPSFHFRTATMFVVVTYVLMLLISRVQDRAFIAPVIAGDLPISRYGSSNGFGVFYTVNDTRVAHWVKSHVPPEGKIANLGGLYNAWATLTEHDVLYVTYNSSTVGEPQPILDELKKVIQGDTSADVQQLLSLNIRYLFLPEQFASSIYHPNVKLIFSAGKSRLYEFTEDAQGRWFPYSFALGLNSVSDITFSTTGNISCPYCGNRFYYDQQDFIHEIVLAEGDEVLVRIKSAAMQRVFVPSVDRNEKNLLIQYGEGLPSISLSEKAIDTYVLPKGQEGVVRMKNGSSGVMRIRAIALQEVMP